MARSTQFLPWLVALVAVLAALLATGQVGRPPAPTRVGVVDVQAVLNGLIEYKVLAEQQKARFEKLDAQVKQSGERLKAMAADIDAMNADDPDRPDQVIAFRKLQASTKTENDLNRSLKAMERGEVLITLYKKVAAVTGVIAQRDQFDLVVHNDGNVPLPESEISDGEAGQVIMQRKVLYTDKALDITDRVIERMNNDYNAGKKP